MLIRVILGLLGILGFLISLLFTLVYYKKMRSDALFLPEVCRLEDSTCQTLIRRPEARLLGIPNFLIGLCFYLAVIALSLMPAGAAPLLERTLVFAGGAAVTFGVFLSYTLIIRLHTHCILCFASHLINACIFGLLLMWGGV